MTETDIGSSVPRRQLGRMLKAAREEAGISLEAAAKELEFSRNKMYRIEGGLTPLRKVDVVAMTQLYSAPADLTQVFVALAAETKSKGWWHSYGAVVPAWFELYVGLEAAATALRHYEPALVPGLLQTPEYAQALISMKPDISDVEIAKKVELRMERQRLLARRRPQAPQVDVIVDEAVLRRPIADRDGMRRQLAHLSNVSQRETVTIRVLPLAVGPHRASAAGAFVILDFPGGVRQPEPTTVYSEGLTGALYLDKPSEINAYVEVWQMLSDLALSVRDSQDLIGTVIKEGLDE